VVKARQKSTSMPMGLPLGRGGWRLLGSVNLVGIFKDRMVLLIRFVESCYYNTGDFCESPSFLSFLDYWLKKNFVKILINTVVIAQKNGYKIHKKEKNCQFLAQA
jgi:hypothetical protein